MVKVDLEADLWGPKMPKGKETGQVRIWNEGQMWLEGATIGAWRSVAVGSSLPEINLAGGPAHAKYFLDHQRFSL